MLIIANSFCFNEIYWIKGWNPLVPEIIFTLEYWASISWCVSESFSFLYYPEFYFQLLPCKNWVFLNWEYYFSRTHLKAHSCNNCILITLPLMHHKSMTYQKIFMMVLKRNIYHWNKTCFFLAVNLAKYFLFHAQRLYDAVNHQRIFTNLWQVGL